MKRGKKLVKREINIDEHWPVFSLEEPRNENSPFVVELNEDFYKEYLYYTHKCYEYQTRIKLIYDHQQLRFNKKNNGDFFPEGSVIDTQYSISNVRSDNITKTEI
jgi:hypothetical protein